MRKDAIRWLLGCDEPWTQYRALVDLVQRPGSDPQVSAARGEMIAHPLVQGLLGRAAAWGERPLKRHNDASHAVHAFSTLADFGLKADDPGMERAVAAVLGHRSPEGAFQSPVAIPVRYGGTGEGAWTWMACDAPVLLFSLLSFRLGGEPSVRRAIDHLASLVDENGRRCRTAPELGGFRGPQSRPLPDRQRVCAQSALPRSGDGEFASGPRGR